MTKYKEMTTNMTVFHLFSHAHTAGGRCLGVFIKNNQ